MKTASGPGPPACKRSAASKGSPTLGARGSARGAAGARGTEPSLGRPPPLARCSVRGAPGCKLGPAGPATRFHSPPGTPAGGLSSAAPGGGICFPRSRGRRPPSPLSSPQAAPSVQASAAPPRGNSASVPFTFKNESRASLTNYLQHPPHPNSPIPPTVQ